MSTILPHSLDVINERLSLIKAPSEVFDPGSDWEHKYLSWLALRGLAGASRPVGALRVRRRVRSSGIVELSVTHVRTQYGPKGHACVSALIACRNDSLLTPLSWTTTCKVKGADGTPIVESSCGISGERSRGMIIQHGEKTHEFKAPDRLTSNWALFDVVQRLPFDAKPITLSMFEDMELLKPEQTLAPGQELDVELGGVKTRLHSFELVGRGILPYTYWLDDNHRLLMAVGGLCTYLYDPSVVLPEEQS